MSTTTIDDLHSSEQEIGRKKAMRRLTVSVLAIITGMAGMTLFSRFQASQEISTAVLPVVPQMNATLIPTPETSDLSKKLADATMQLQQAKEDPIRGYAIDREQPASDEYIASPNKVGNKPISAESSVKPLNQATTEPAKVATAQHPENPKTSTVASNSQESTSTNINKEESALGTESASAKVADVTSEKSTAKEVKSNNNARYANKNYAVQVGMFTNPTNAQSLQSKLNKAGVTAVVETRVYLGPFSNKNEADIALKKAKELGLNAVVLAPTKL